MKNPLDENSSRGFFALFRRKCPLTDRQLYLHFSCTIVAYGKQDFKTSLYLLINILEEIKLYRHGLESYMIIFPIR